jgi:phage gp36-like protein
MAYISHEQLAKQFPEKDLSELAQDSTGFADDDAAKEIILQLILDVESFVDSYLNQRYTVPLSPVPDSIRNATGVITYYRMHERRSEMITDRLQQMYDQTIDWLRDLANGIASLPIPPATEGAKVRGYFGAETRIFQGISHDNDTDKFFGF